MFDQNRSARRVFAPLLLAACAALAWGCSPQETEGSASVAEQPVTPKPGFNAAGELTRPVGYREWVYVGAPLTPNELNPPEAAFPEFHNVYIHPDDYAHYRSTGQFRDGTIVVKELVSVGSKQAASGNGYFMGEFIGLEAAVKDTRRFPDASYNWGYFSFGHVPEAQYASSAAVLPMDACATCHLANAAEDMVFTQYYPVLRGAKRRSGTR